MKFIDSLKFYQKSLSELVSTLSVEEKIAVKELITNFLNQHYYFSTVWPYLNSQKQKKY